ncbi:helix-turn-helix transcriptional regulator [Sporolactobacillus shoreicorticis]|nr:helix-turn-helix transcriptional regulator [Sporolactobacillus shoreicorticis]
MENDGFVLRIQYNEMPVKVEYSLTEKGKSFLPILYELSAWGMKEMRGG